MVRVPGEICWYVKKKKNDNLCRKTQLNRQKSAEVIVPKKKKKKKKKMGRTEHNSKDWK